MKNRRIALALACVLSVGLFTVPVPAQEASPAGAPELPGAWAQTEGPAVLYKNGDLELTLDAEELPKGGIILQMIDDDPEEEDSAEQNFSEDPGFPADAFSGEDMPEGETVNVSFPEGEYDGDLYNATGYYLQPADVLNIEIMQDAVLEGDIACTSYVHGIMLNDRSIDDIIAAVEEANQKHKPGNGRYAASDSIEYVLIDSRGNVADSKDDAIAVQFTGFTKEEDYLNDLVINRLNYNGRACVQVTVSGTWKVRSASLITSLDIREEGKVYGEIVELADGSLLIIPSEEISEPAKYGAAHEAEDEAAEDKTDEKIS